VLRILSRVFLEKTRRVLAEAGTARLPAGGRFVSSAEATSADKSAAATTTETSRPGGRSAITLLIKAHLTHSGCGEGGGGLCLGSHGGGHRRAGAQRSESLGVAGLSV